MLDPLYAIVTRIVLAIHAGLSPAFGRDSGLTWGLSIVLLTVVVRLLLFPLFVKQIKTQRAMQELQPKIKDLQARHKGDRETLNVELMKLYREHGANPLSGCLPLIAQMPVFFALFHVLNTIAKDKALYGMTPELAQSAASAKVFGAPIASSFTNAAEAASLGASPTTVRIVAIVLIVLMGLTTFITQKQLMARSAASNVDNPLAAQQKILLYVLPLSFAVFGVNFPMGVLIYWLTTNLWSMGQQFIVLRRLHPVPAVVGAESGSATGSAGGAPREGTARAATGRGPSARPGNARLGLPRLPWLRAAGSDAEPAGPQPRSTLSGSSAPGGPDRPSSPGTGDSRARNRGVGDTGVGSRAAENRTGNGVAADGVAEDTADGGRQRPPGYSGQGGQRQQPVTRSRSARRGGKGGKNRRR